MPTDGPGSERHFVTFINLSTQFAAASPVVSRDYIHELIEARFSNFPDRYGRTPNIFVSDKSAEYLSAHVQRVLHANNCDHIPTSMYSPEDNGIAERLNATLLVSVRKALHTAEMDKKYLPPALQDAVFKYNLRLNSATGRTPFYDCLGVQQTPKRLLVLGQLGIVHQHSATKPKLQPRGQWIRYVYTVDRKLVMTMDHFGSFLVACLGFSMLLTNLRSICRL